MLDWSPWVGKAWLNAEAMKGSERLTGIAIGSVWLRWVEKFGEYARIKSVKTFVSTARSERASIYDHEKFGMLRVCVQWKTKSVLLAFVARAVPCESGVCLIGRNPYFSGLSLVDE